MKRNLILGIDTSNYTTSLALMDTEGNLVSDARKLLPVDQGTLGLRQSDALFQHIKILPVLTKELLKGAGEYQIVAVSGATKPRPQEGSYMPVFLAAGSYGETLSELLSVPFFAYSHQEGHIEAGLWSLKLKIQQPFLTFQLSGGTTELLLINPDKDGYQIDLIGGTKDISAGQLIDRIGVKLGLPFPAGPHLEALANSCKLFSHKAPFSTDANFVSFSGPETYFNRLIEKQAAAEEVAYAVLQCIGESIAASICNALKSCSCEDILLVGGVASNSHIRELLAARLGHSTRLHFTLPKLCTDNAVGICSLGVNKYNSLWRNR